MEQHGYSLIELTVAAGIMGILVVGTIVFFGTSIGAYRRQFEQVLTTEDARLQLEKVADVIRASVNKSPSDPWLISAGDNELIIYSNVDTDSAVEQVRFTYTGTDIVRGVTKDGQPEEVTTLARTIRNGTYGVPVFSYYDENDSQISAASATPSSVERIGMTLYVDANTNQAPEYGAITTIVAPRQVTLADTAGSTNILGETSLNYGADPPVTDQVHVTLTDLPASITTTGLSLTSSLNDGRLATYQGAYYTNINYQAVTVGSYLPGWYAWIGPIHLATSGEETYTAIDQVPISELCVGTDLATLQQTCPTRTVSQGSFSASYQPILTYTSYNGQYYVRDMTFTFTGEACQVISATTVTGANVEDLVQACMGMCNPTHDPSATPESCRFALKVNSTTSGTCACTGEGPLPPDGPIPSTFVVPGDLDGYHSWCADTCNGIATCGYPADRSGDECACSCFTPQCGDTVCDIYYEDAVSCPADCS